MVDAPVSKTGGIISRVSSSLTFGTISPGRRSSCPLVRYFTLASNRPDSHLRYEPNERCPPLLPLLVGIQGTLIGLPITVMVVVIVGLAGGQNEEYLAWTMFGALILVAAVTTLQASRVWRFGAGHTFISVSSPNYLAVSVLALEAGGPTLLPP